MACQRDSLTATRYGKVRKYRLCRANVPEVVLLNTISSVVRCLPPKGLKKQ